MNPAPGFLEAFLHVIKTVDFKGRARRAEYWKFTAIYYCIYTPVGILTEYLDSHNPYPSATLTVMGLIMDIILIAFVLGVFLQYLSLNVRRLHDTGHSGKCLLLALIPFVGSIIMLVLLCTDSTHGDNQYGPSPKYPDGNSSSNELV